MQNPKEIAMKNDNDYREYIEREKIDCFDRIVDIWLEKELSWQKRASMIIDVVKDYLMMRGMEG